MKLPKSEDGELWRDLEEESQEERGMKDMWHPSLEIQKGHKYPEPLFAMSTPLFPPQNSALPSNSKSSREQYVNSGWVLIKLYVQKQGRLDKGRSLLSTFGLNNTTIFIRVYSSYVFWLLNTSILGWFLVLSLFFRWEDWCTMRLKDLPRITEVPHGGAGMEPKKSVFKILAFLSFSSHNKFYYCCNHINCIKQYGIFP